jgi:hypothetical protein
VVTGYAIKKKIDDTSGGTIKSRIPAAALKSREDAHGALIK